MEKKSKTLTIIIIAILVVVLAAGFLIWHFAIADKTKPIGASSDDQAQNKVISEDIGIDRAKEIALENVSGASESHITDIDRDENHDGVLVYEVEITYDGHEYDFEIDASTGKILECSNEAEHGMD